MSYNPHFNPKPLSYNTLPAFTSWSQCINNILTPSLSSFPFRNLPLPSFNPFHPPLIHQQNNFYNSNFTIAPNPLAPSLPQSINTLSLLSES